MVYDLIAEMNAIASEQRLRESERMFARDMARDREFNVNEEMPWKIYSRGQNEKFKREIERINFEMSMDNQRRSNDAVRGICEMLKPKTSFKRSMIHLRFNRLEKIKKEWTMQ